MPQRCKMNCAYFVSSACRVGCDHELWSNTQTKAVSSLNERWRHEAVPDAAPTPEASQSNVGYLKFMDNTRKAVAIAMAVCGLSFAIADANRHDYLAGTLRRDAGLWGLACQVFGYGVLACVTATLVLVVEAGESAACTKAVHSAGVARAIALRHRHRRCRVPGDGHIVWGWPGNRRGDRHLPIARCPRVRNPSCAPSLQHVPRS